MKMLEKPIITPKEAVDLVKDGDSIMFGSFLVCGAAELLIDALAISDKKDLTIICIATDYEDRGVGKLITAKKVKKAITSHIGTNPQTQKQYIEKTLEVNFVPQGTLVERIRAAATGIGGFLTPTGLGTIVQEGKEIINVDGKDYLLEKPLKGKFAFVHAKKADKFGNLQFHGSANNSNLFMAMAADITIVEAEEIVEIGEIDPDFVHLSGIFVDYLVKA